MLGCFSLVLGCRFRTTQFFQVAKIEPCRLYRARWIVFRERGQSQQGGCFRGSRWCEQVPGGVQLVAAYSSPRILALRIPGTQIWSRCDMVAPKRPSAPAGGYHKTLPLCHFSFRPRFAFLQNCIFAILQNREIVFAQFFRIFIFTFLASRFSSVFLHGLRMGDFLLLLALVRALLRNPSPTPLPFYAQIHSPKL